MHDRRPSAVQFLAIDVRYRMATQHEIWVRASVLRSCQDGVYVKVRHVKTLASAQGQGHIPKFRAKETVSLRGKLFSGRKPKKGPFFRSSRRGEAFGRRKAEGSAGEVIQSKMAEPNGDGLKRKGASGESPEAEKKRSKGECFFQRYSP